MLRNYFRIAIRNFRKNKIFSFINILGLSIGLACFMLIGAFVSSELSYDRYADNAKDIYRVMVSVTGNGDAVVYPNVDAAVGEGIKKAFPEVKSTTRLAPFGTNFISYQEKQFKEENLASVDSNFLEFFSLPLLEGNIKDALVQPNSIVVARSFAKKYFGDGDPMGKSLVIGKGEAFKVTGMIDKVPDNSHFHFDAFLSLSSFHRTPETWSNLGFYTYLLLNEKADPKKLEAKFPQLVSEYVVPEVQHDMGVSLAEAQQAVNTFRFSLQPLTDIHLYSNTKYELESNGDIHYVYIFAALAIFILLLACVNFTNLSTASAAKRSREVGIRKVIGSLKQQLIFQFLTESVLLTFLAAACALMLVFVLLPYFNQVSGKNISFSFFLSFQSLVLIFSLSLIVGILAGIYPAFFLSSFGTIKVLKGSSSSQSAQRKPLRSGLIVFQFFVSTALIIATGIVYQQLHFMQNKKLGYDKEQVLFLPDAGLLGKNQLAFKQQLLRDNRVVSASICRSVPGNSNMEGTEIFPRSENLGGTTIHSNIFYIDYDYLKTLGIQVLEGRNFSRDFATDSSGVIINETAAHELGWNNTNAIGNTIVRSGQQEFKVIGVVADFHYASVKQKIAPLMMLLGNNFGGLVVKIKTDDIRDFLGEMKNKWNGFNPAGPFEYFFLDDKFAALYASEERTQQIFSVFAVLAIIIASLGLFGLSAFIIEQRTKEIGIRKVLGASVNQVLILVSKEFLLLVTIAFVLAVPVTWWVMQFWLQDFAYRVNISGWVFAGSGLVAILIASITISFQAVRAAISNPVKALRSE